MGSGLGFGRLTRQLAEMYEFNNYQYFVAIGVLLSDGWISIYKAKTGITARLGFKQSLSKFSYLFYVYKTSFIFAFLY
jgi:LAGLIDADG DNA endonuclease family